MIRKIIVLSMLVLMLFSLTTIAGAQEGRVGESKEGLITTQTTASGGTMVVDDSPTAAELAQGLVGSEVTISNVSYTGDARGSGVFGGALGYIGIESGIMLASGRVIDVVGPNVLDGTTLNFGLSGDTDLNGLIPGYTTNDATVLEFDFICPPSTAGEDVISFQYVFGSEEYNEFVNSAYNDVFGFFLNGTNVALLPDGVTPVSINNVNNGYSGGGGLPGINPSNPAFYINNDLDDGGPFINIEADGLTVVLGVEAAINPGVNHMKLAIADAGDHILDSWVFIQGDSFQCAPLNSPPVADAGGDYSGNEGSGIALDGSASNDPDGDPITFAWSVDSPLCSFDNPFSATPTLTCDDNGLYMVTLVVDDGQETDSDEALVTVHNVAPTADFNAPQYVIAGDDFELSLTNPYDPSSVDTAAGFRYDFNCGDGSGYSALAGGLYGSDQNRRLFKVDPLTGAATFVGFMPSRLATEIEYDNLNQVMYAEQEGGQPLLYTIDIETAAGTGSVQHLFGALNGLEFVGSTLYGTFIQGPGYPSNLVIVDTSTGGLTFVGPTGFGPISGLAYEGTSGVMYGITAGGTPSNLVTIDLATGAATLVGPTGLDRIGSIEFGPGGYLYGGLSQNASAFAGYLVRIDPATGATTIVGNTGYSITGLTFVAGNSTVCSTSPDEVGTRTVKGRITDKDGGSTEYTAAVTVLPPSAATNSSLCYYDAAEDIAGQQFKLIFTPDMQNWPQYKLPASNPGQFFYNVFYVGAGPADFDISIPDPFVTKGANPVHVYTEVAVVAKDGFKCFEPVPGSEIYAGDLDGLDGLTSSSGMLYVAVHLDYGLKGTTGYLPNMNNDALDAADEITVLIPNLGEYTFAVSGSQTDSRTIENLNDFKKIPGFGGLVLDEFDDPIIGETVTIELDGVELGTAITDEDGWYMFVYKHTGKRADYTVMVDGFDPKTGELKANKFAEVNFP